MILKRVIATESPVLTGIPTLVGNGTSVCGKMRVEGDIRVDGQVEGRFRCGGRLMLGKSGRIRAERIECTSADISGSVEGTLIVTGLLHIRPGGASTERYPWDNLP